MCSSVGCTYCILTSLMVLKSGVTAQGRAPNLQIAVKDIESSTDNCRWYRPGTLGATYSLEVSIRRHTLSLGLDLVQIELYIFFKKYSHFLIASVMIAPFFCARHKDGMTYDILHSVAKWAASLNVMALLATMMHKPPGRLSLTHKKTATWVQQRPSGRNSVLLTYDVLASWLPLLTYKLSVDGSCYGYEEKLKLLSLKVLDCRCIFNLTVSLFRYKYLHRVRGCITRGLGVPHVQSHRQFPSMALLLLLYNSHFLPGLARQG